MGGGYLSLVRGLAIDHVQVLGAGQRMSASGIGGWPDYCRRLGGCKVGAAADSDGVGEAHGSLMSTVVLRPAPGEGISTRQQQVGLIS